MPAEHPNAFSWIVKLNLLLVIYLQCAIEPYIYIKKQQHRNWVKTLLNHHWICCVPFKRMHYTF